MTRDKEISSSIIVKRIWTFFFYHFHSLSCDVCVAFCRLSYRLPNVYCPDVFILQTLPDSKVHGANMEPIWVLTAPDRPHVGPMNLAIRAMRLGVIELPGGIKPLPEPIRSRSTYLSAILQRAAELLFCMFQNKTFKITSIPPMRQWVNATESLSSIRSIVTYSYRRLSM